MKNQMLLSIGCIVWILAFLSGCASLPDSHGCRALDPMYITTKDAFGIESTTMRPNPVCMKQTGDPFCGRCVTLVTGKVRYVGQSKKHFLHGKPWSQIQKEAVIVPSEDAAMNKAYILKNCKEHDECGGIKDWRIKLDMIDDVPKIQTLH